MGQQASTDVTANPSAEQVLRSLTLGWQAHAATRLESLVGSALLNLVVCSPSPDDADLINEMVPTLAEQFPCRLIHVVLQPTARPDGECMRATTCMHSHSVRSHVQQVTCEQVTIEAQGECVEQLEGLVIPLLHPDLPVLVWWRGSPPFAGSFFEHMLEACDRFFFDSSEFRHTERDLLWIASLKRGESVDKAFKDLNWIRLLPWKSLLAQFFDGPRHRPYLDQIEAVEIEYVRGSAAEHHLPAQPWLLAAWLASRLRWRPASASGPDEQGRVRLELRSSGLDVSVTFVPVESGAVAQGLVGVTLSTSAPTRGRFNVCYTPDGSYVRTGMALEEGPEVERVVRREDIREVALIGRTIEIPGEDPVYDQVLETLEELLGGDGSLA